jgi:hypothetical protein
MALMTRTLRSSTLPLAIAFALLLLAQPAATFCQDQDPSSISEACDEQSPAEGFPSGVGSFPSAEPRGIPSGGIDFALPTEHPQAAPQSNEQQGTSEPALEATPPVSPTDFVFLPCVRKAPPPLGWVPIGPAEGDALLDIDVAPNDSDRLYASTRTGIYRSLDRGSTWELTVGGFFRQLVIDPQQPNILYSGPHDDSYRYGIYKSTDGGDTWTHYDEGMTCDNPAGLSISATDPNILFTGSF